MTADELLTQLQPDSEMARLVRRVAQERLTWVVVPNSGVLAWEGREPASWAIVSTWLSIHHVTLVRI
jgi:hypothetical protein